MLLQGVGIPSKYMNLLKDLYSNTTCHVRPEGSVSDPFTTTSGVRQRLCSRPEPTQCRCVAIDYWLNNALMRTPNTGANYHSRITDLCYADDVVVFAEFTDAISDALTALLKKQHHSGSSSIGPRPKYSRSPTFYLLYTHLVSSRMIMSRL